MKFGMFVLRSAVICMMVLIVAHCEMNACAPAIVATDIGDHRETIMQYALQCTKR